MAIPMPPKDPSEKLDYSLEWDDQLTEDEGLSTSVWAVSEGDVVIEADTRTGNKTTVWVSGGTAGEIAILTNTVTTSGGRIYEQSIKIRVVEK